MVYESPVIFRLMNQKKDTHIDGPFRPVFFALTKNDHAMSGIYGK